MKHVYTIPEVRRAEMQKACARFDRKAAEYGKVFSAVFGEKYTKSVDVRSNATNAVIGSRLVECFDLTLDAEIIRKDGYCVIAKIEHLPTGNFVTPFINGVKKGWFERSSYCEHCRTNHFRKNTFIVHGENGEEKQVGSTCLKDYCGINPNIFAQYRNLEAMVEDAKIDLYVDEDFEYFGETLYSLRKVLAFAYDIIDLQGYVRATESGSNKSKLIIALSSNIMPSNIALKQADALIEDCKQIENSDEYPPFLSDKAAWLIHNIKTLALNDCCKESHLGFVAYAPIAYGTYKAEKVAWELKKAEREIAAQTSGFVGKIGDKITFDVAEMKLMTTWENDWGHTTYLYRFTDTSGNVLIWYASKRMEDGCKRVTAKVRNHNVRDDVKQTIITNCKSV